MGATAREAHQPHWRTCASTINVGSPRTRPRRHHHPSHPSARTRSRLSPTCREPRAAIHTLPLGDCGGRTSFVGPRGNGVARATFVRRHRAGIASGVALTIAAAAVVGLRRHRQRLQVARGRAQRRWRLGRQRQEGLVGPAQQADQPARRRRAQRGRQDPAGRRPGRRRGRHPRPSTPAAASPSRPAGSRSRTAAPRRDPDRPATSRWPAAPSPAPTPRPARSGPCATTRASASRS